MNMMTGAVAINGGVGVMEIHQPQVAVSQMAASAAQAAEQVALNAHITLRELKTKIDTVVEKKLPTFKTLMEKEPVAVAQTMVNGAKLTAYENGYAVYEVDGSHTVMAVDRCNDYRYDFTLTRSPLHGWMDSRMKFSSTPARSWQENASGFSMSRTAQRCTAKLNLAAMTGRQAWMRFWKR